MNKHKPVYPTNSSLSPTIKMSYPPSPVAQRGLGRYPSASAMAKAEMVGAEPAEVESVEQMPFKSRKGSMTFEMLEDMPPNMKSSMKMVGGPRDCFIDDSPYIETLGVKMDEFKLRQFLTSKNWPVGVQTIFTKNVKRVPLRIFICDDSGSMVTSDGKRIHGDGKKTIALQCTRWAELSESLKFHLEVAQTAQLPSEFRLLNGASPVLVGTESPPGRSEVLAEGELSGLDRLHLAFEESPSGQTPLCWHIKDVIRKLEPIADKLRASGQKVAIVIATDGEPTDGDLVETLRPLQRLPVWLIVRLCTDDDRIVDFWNSVDSQLELDMDVIDDLFRESEGVDGVNGWLTYGEPLHRLREFGITVKEFDLLDESQLTGDQIRSIAAMIFDVPIADVPHPDINPRGFIDTVSRMSAALPLVWDPVSKTMQQWIKTKRVQAMYKAPSSCLIL